MSQDIRDFLTPCCELLALGEPTHQEPAFGRVRNRLFAQLVERGFRSIALETDRVAALAVDDYVRHGAGTLDAVLDEGFTHGFGAQPGNRELVAWMREFNRDRGPAEQLAFHGFDTPTENTTAPSPRGYLEHARDYLRHHLPDHLRLDVDIAELAGEDERWSREQAVLDAASSPGETPEAVRLRRIADDLLTQLYLRAPELIEAGSRAEWFRARTRLQAGLGLLRYHAQVAVRGLGLSDRVSGLLGLRDALMAQNLLDIRAIEAGRGPTLVFSHNLHLQQAPSAWAGGELECRWNGAGRIVGPLLGERYVFVAGSLGRSEVLGLAEPVPGTYEALVGQGVDAAWALVEPPAPGEGRARSDTAPQQGYAFDRASFAGASAVLHIGDGTAAATAG
ncbi:erythromycin esterase family protein [Kitasatospora aureofaciens]|uniref:Erythromycin esterase n=1 Tax=Kitasatospora aureofaciens TaxID=1894 RepID=A0A1E7N7R0_KITAU|nr:erythromycin esterase family protein [Kitasatospora aureofaciens]OEV36736.1 erythromycin esterase [Kitasatospora aureofaciens]GGU69721.1 erythromycin esterase [Kitasatospora aureofaciens]